MEAIPVQFRAFGNGDVIAVFPTSLGTADSSTCSSYMHVGQHASCSAYGIVQATRLATPAEYDGLRRELEAIGYTLRICKRVSRSMHATRIAELKRWMA